jgi:hypothetical protein
VRLTNACQVELIGLLTSVRGATSPRSTGPSRACRPHGLTSLTVDQQGEQCNAVTCGFELEVGFEPTTFRLRDGCSASIWSAPDGPGLLTLDASSI